MQTCEFVYNGVGCGYAVYGRCQYCNKMQCGSHLGMQPINDYSFVGRARESERWNQFCDTFPADIQKYKDISKALCERFYALNFAASPACLLCRLRAILNGVEPILRRVQQEKAQAEALIQLQATYLRHHWQDVLAAHRRSTSPVSLRTGIIRGVLAWKITEAQRSTGERAWQDITISTGYCTVRTYITSDNQQFQKIDSQRAEPLGPLDFGNCHHLWQFPHWLVDLAKKYGLLPK